MADLEKFLTDAGYQRVPLKRNGVGHFQAQGTLNGHRVAVLIDTGAASTVMDLALAKTLELVLMKLDVRGGGAGGANLEVHLVPGAKLELGSVIPKPRAVMAMDLTHVNEAMVLKGAKPIEVILGVDVFDAQAAVIDYGTQSMFLKP